MAWWDGIFGSNTNSGLAASNGTGTYGMIPTGDGSFAGVNQDAYNTWTKAGGTGGVKSNEAGNSSGWLGAGAGLLSAGGSVMNALTGMQAMGLAKKQFDYEKALGNANLYNTATQVNNAYDQQASVGNALAGSSISDAQKQASIDAAAAKHLKTTI